MKNSWWWTEELSETCSVLFQKEIWKISASSWFYCKNHKLHSHIILFNPILPYTLQPPRYCEFTPSIKVRAVDRRCRGKLNRIKTVITVATYFSLVKGKHALSTEELPFTAVVFCLSLLVAEFKDFLHISTLGGEVTERKNKSYWSNIPELNSKQLIIKFSPNFIILSHLRLGLTLNALFEDFALVKSSHLLLGFSSWLFLSKIFGYIFMCTTHHSSLYHIKPISCALIPSPSLDSTNTKWRTVATLMCAKYNNNKVRLSL